MSATTESAADLLAKVRIAKPCPARWADMAGDDRSRFCNQCQKNVYNLSALTAADAAALIRAKEGNLCGMFYQRADGTMLTADCPVGVARHWQRAKAFAGAAVATLVMTFASLGMARQAEREGQERERSRFAEMRAEAVWRFKELLGLNPPMLVLGALPARPLPPGNLTTVTNPPPLSGEAFIQPATQPVPAPAPLGQK